MAACTYCGTETKLFVNDVPVCIECDAKLEDGKKPPFRPPESGQELPGAEKAD